MRPPASRAACWFAAAFSAALVLALVTPCRAATLASDGSHTDVQAKITAASDGDTVTLPSGTFTWTSGVTISGKGIHLRGAGAGGVDGRSLTSLAVGTGTKTFTTEAGRNFVAGETVRAVLLHEAATFMEGTVTSYSGTTLVLSVTTTGGSGTYALWALRRNSATTVRHSAGTNANLLTLSDDASHAVELSGIRFEEGTVTGGGEATHLFVACGTGQPVKVFDCSFSTAGQMRRSILWRGNRGLIYRCNFDSSFGQDDGAIVLVNDDDASWTTASTMGTADTTGLSNTYIEDCRFTDIYLQALDFDGNSRVVFRHNILDHSALTSHGSDTGPAGLRHFEIYENTLHFNNTVAGGGYAVPMDYGIYIRGGTGVIANNTLADINSSDWGNKNEIKFALFNVQYAPQTPGGCQTTYPAYRQHGRSHNGTAVVLDPIYIWGNTGGANQSPAFADYGTDHCGNGLTTADFVVLDRDYYIGTAKPGWTAYTYPHPLRGAAATTMTATNATVTGTLTLP